MRVLIIGDGNSIHLRNYIKVVLDSFVEVKITLFDVTETKERRETMYNYYLSKNITVVSAQQDSIIPISKMVSALKLLRMVKALKNLGSFDYCIVHYIEIIRVCAVLLNKSNYQKIVPVFWGSDLLRNNKIDTFYYRCFFHKAYKIVFNTENMKGCFQKIFKDEFDNKTEVIKFPSLSFKEIERLKLTVCNEITKQTMGLPRNKYIVICGHAGTKQEQYEELIEAISTCDSEVKERCFFVWLMTYGHSDLHEYQNKIKKLVEEKALDGVVLCNYMEHDDMLKLFMCSDIYITTIKTDAFSGVMQENLYVGAMLIYGKWLNYYEIENSEIIARSVDKVSDITKALNEVVINYEKLKPKLKDNSILISEISAPESIKNLWFEKVFML